jgi:hypothetical protein
MTKLTLVIHWNEISLPADAAVDDLERNDAWAELARSAFESFLQAQKTRPDTRISFSKGVFHGHVAGRPFQSWMERWLGKERMQKLRHRAIQPQNLDQPAIEQLDCELSVAGRRGEGMTRAHLAESWVWSLGISSIGAMRHEIQADKTVIDSEATDIVSVRNLACIQHSERWAHELAEWGMKPSENHVIDEVDGLIFIMYPFDHGYKHIHVHSRNDPKLNAKYRVDKFERLSSMSSSELDRKMEAWIARHRDLLLQSWNRCQAGKLPLRVLRAPRDGSRM